MLKKWISSIKAYYEQKFCSDKELKARKAQPFSIHKVARIILFHKVKRTRSYKWIKYYNIHRIWSIKNLKLARIYPPLWLRGCNGAQVVLVAFWSPSSTASTPDVSGPSPPVVTESYRRHHGDPGCGDRCPNCWRTQSVENARISKFEGRSTLIKGKGYYLQVPRYEKSPLLAIVRRPASPRPSLLGRVRAVATRTMAYCNLLVCRAQARPVRSGRLLGYSLGVD